MEGKFLDTLFSSFELDLPHLDSMEAYIKYILPKVKEYGDSINNPKAWQGARWMEIQGNDNWDKSFIHIFMPDNEYLIFDNGVMTKRSWRQLGGSILLDEGRATILYEVDYIDGNFLILRQNGTNRYFVLGKEGFVKKIKFDWQTAMEELYNEYRNNSKFSIWVMALIGAIVLFVFYFYYNL